MLKIDVNADLDDIDKPGLVIDGQHRLLGMQRFHPDCKVCVVALLNVDDMEKAFQFLVINSKAAKVPTDHIRTLALDYQEDELAERLKTARVVLHDNLKYVGIMDTDEDSPFAGNIALVSHAHTDARLLRPQRRREPDLTRHQGTLGGNGPPPAREVREAHTAGTETRSVGRVHGHPLSPEMACATRHIGI
jgi:hypothetical protein